MSMCWVLEIDEMNDLSGVEIDRLIEGIIQRKPGIAQLNTMYDRYIFITHY